MFLLKKSECAINFVTLQPKYKQSSVIYTYLRMGQLQERYKNYRVPQSTWRKAYTLISVRLQSKQSPEVTMGGHKVLMFRSNAYTGLTGDDRRDRRRRALLKYGSGCAGSRFPQWYPLTFTYSWRKSWQSLSIGCRALFLHRLLCECRCYPPVGRSW